MEIKYFFFQMDTGKPVIAFRPDVELSEEEDEIFSGELSLDPLKIWAQNKCIPIVRFVCIQLKSKILNLNRIFFSQTEKSLSKMLKS